MISLLGEISNMLDACMILGHSTRCCMHQSHIKVGKNVRCNTFLLAQCWVFLLRDGKPPWPKSWGSYCHYSSNGYLMSASASQLEWMPSWLNSWRIFAGFSAEEIAQEDPFPFGWHMRNRSHSGHELNPSFRAGRICWRLAFPLTEIWWCVARPYAQVHKE